MIRQAGSTLSILGIVVLLVGACTVPQPAVTDTGDTAAATEAPAPEEDAGSATEADTAEPEDAQDDTAEEPAASSTEQELDALAADTPVASIALNGDAISVDGEGASVDASTVTITQAGTFEVSGTLDDGQILVDAGDDDLVRIVLNGASISNSTTAPISAMNAGKLVVVLAAGTGNSLSDADTYVYEGPEDEPDAALFSTADLVIEGDGTLTVDANYSDGISSKAGLVVTSGMLQVDAVGDGIRGKDFLEVENGEFTVNAGGDALKSNEDEDAEKGYIAIKNGTFNLTAGEDAIQAETRLSILDGDFVIVTGGGSGAALGEDRSAKALNAGVAIEVSGGVFDIDAADDGFNSNETLIIDGGTFTIACGDDAIHSDLYLTINDGKIDITESAEGIEGAIIIINDGDISVVSSDDGINVSGDANPEETGPGGMGPPPGASDSSEVTAIPTAEPESVTESSVQYVLINGGNIFVNANGDGLDANGSIEMSDGFVLVAGPTRNDNGALDYDETFNMLGGVLVASGSAGMAQTPSQNSSQPSVRINFDSALAAGTVVHVQSSTGETLFTLAPVKDFQSIVYSSPLLETGVEYEIYVGGSTTGEMVDGFTMESEYTPGELFDTFTVEGAATSVGATMMGGPGGGRP